MITVVESALFALITLAILVIASVAEPRRARCPRGTYLHTGIRASGRFECARNLIGRENDAEQPAGVLGGKIYCTGGARPIVVSSTVVGCQRNAL